MILINIYIIWCHDNYGNQFQKSHKIIIIINIQNDYHNYPPNFRYHFGTAGSPAHDPAEFSASSFRGSEPGGGQRGDPGGWVFQIGRPPGHGLCHGKCHESMDENWRKAPFMNIFSGNYTVCRINYHYPCSKNPLRRCKETPKTTPKTVSEGV